MQDQFDTFLVRVEAQTGSGNARKIGLPECAAVHSLAAEVAGRPQFVKDEFEAYLERGILAACRT